MSVYDSRAAAINAWRGILGDDAVISNPDRLEGYTQSVCGSTRNVVAVLKPSSLDQVQRIVATANEFKVPLYPISCGKQWGMGSRLPVRDGAAIVELSKMNRIIEVNARFHYAVVEPGVTQRQLIDYIKAHQLPLMLNVTGATSDTSLIGNAMDRGVGYFDSRANGISNLQIVLGNGKTIRTGFSHYERAKTKNLYPHGIGPSLDGLFLQANFGIVTSACIDLMPAPDEHMAVVIKINSGEKLPELIDALASLRARGVFATVAHVGNRERSYITMAPLVYEQLVRSGEPLGEQTRAKAIEMLDAGGFGPWSAVIGLLGTKAQLKTAKKEIRKALHGLASTMFLNDSLLKITMAFAQKLSFLPVVKSRLMLLRAIQPIYGFTAGEASDQSLKAVYWSADDWKHLDAPDPDHSDSGLLFCLPIIPADGAAVDDVVRDTCEVFSRYGFEAAITVNLISTKAMEGVVSLAFDRRNPEQAKRAHDCIQEMEARYMEQGYPPYRVGINSMHHVVREDDPYWQTVGDLKGVFDPNHIIAPGRYNVV